jgi:hypothetical protein
MTEKVFLQKSDFDVKYNRKRKIYHIVNYSDSNDCPLARACKRHFKTEDVEVSSFDTGVRIDGKHWSNTDEWCYFIASNVCECLHNGDDTHYFVTLTK